MLVCEMKRSEIFFGGYTRILRDFEEGLKRSFVWFEREPRGLSALFLTGNLSEKRSRSERKTSAVVGALRWENARKIENKK